MNISIENARFIIKSVFYIDEGEFRLRMNLNGSVLVVSEGGLFYEEGAKLKNGKI